MHVMGTDRALDELREPLTGSGVRRRVVTVGVIAIGTVVAVTAFTLLALNGSIARDPTVVLSILSVLTYMAVGGVLASRRPKNPVGWLLLTGGFGLLLGGACSEWVTYSMSTNPGGLPFGEWAAWLNAWSFVTVGAIPLILALFPTGHVSSPRWRWLPAAILACLGALALASMFKPGAIQVSGDINPENPLGIDALGSLLDTIVEVAAIGLLVTSIASVVSIVQRFRHSTGEERQQLRWLVWTAAFTGLFLALALVSGIGLAPGETRLINTAAVFGILMGIGFGIPIACAVAILKYRLYDLDLVVKKTVVFTIVAAFITALYLAALALAAVSGIGALAGAVVFVLTFNPVRRRARTIADRVVYGKRATPFEVLSEFSERLGETYSIDDVLPRMAQLLGTSTGATEVRVWLLQDRELSEVAAWPVDLSPLPARVVIGAELPAFGDDVSVSAVTHQGELLGAITLRMPPKDPMDAAKQRLVSGLASQAGLALRNVRLVRDLRSSRRRIVAAQDERAKQLERNIHDGAQQQLVALSVQLKLAEQMMDRDADKAKALLSQLQGAAGAALEDLRDLARGIYPPLLADKGLTVALEAQARKAAVPVNVEADGIGRFSQDIEATVYFCTLEALNNVSKYAVATSAHVRLAADDGHLRFEIEDDGAGFDPAANGYGTGLQGMADRLAALGGELSVTSSPGAGTTVAGRLPVEPRP
jgi:signal transduction histidine kinase